MLQSEIRTMQDANKDALTLIEKINEGTDNINNDTETDLMKLKEQIRKDLKELKSFSDPDIYATRVLEPYDRDNKYGIKEDTPYPVICPKINLGGTKEYDFQKDDCSEVEDVAILEYCHTYAPLFRDGVFADEVERHATRQSEIDALYRHWPAILVMAYEEMLKAYKNKATKELKNALEKKAQAFKRQMDIRAALMATEEGGID